MGGLLSSKHVTSYVAWMIFLALAACALGTMLVQSFFPDGAFGLGNYAEALGRPRAWTLLLNSLLLAGLATLAAGIGGVTLAIGAAKSAVPFRIAIISIFSLPMLFPPYVLANGWFQVLGRQGLASGWFGDSVGAITSGLLFGLPGGVLVLGTAFLPVVMLLSMASINSVNPSLEEAARLTCGWTGVLRYITLPLARPGILLSLTLTFLLTFGELSVPSFLRLNVFPIESFTQFSAFYNAGRATAAAIPFAIGAFLLLIATRKWTGTGEYHFRWTHAARPPISLDGFEPWIAATFLALGTLLVVLPCAALVNQGFSLERIAAAWENAADSLAWSLCYGAAAATAITTLGFFLGYASQRRTFPAARALSLITLMMFALPGTLIGIGLVVAWNRPSFGWLYAGPATLIIGLTLQYAAIGERGVASNMAQIAPSLEEAAAVAGATWIQRIRTIILPLMRPSLLTIWMLSFIMCLRDTSLPLLLSSPGRDPLTARTLTWMANGSPELISALCLFSMALPIIPAMIAFAAYRAGGRP